MPRYVHAQNSAGALMIDADICNAVRLGISLYGYYPSEYVKEEADIELQPSVELMTQIVQTKNYNLVSQSAMAVLIQRNHL